MNKYMNKYTRIAALVMACIVFCAGGLYIGYSSFRKPPENKPVSDIEEMNPSDSEALALYEGEDIRINQDTEIVYEYIYEEDGRTEVTRDSPPYFMLDKTFSEVQETFSSWDIVKFDEDEVILRKEVVGTSVQSYTVGAQDGYVAVFYSGVIDGNRLKEITDTPVSVLPEEDKNRLAEGIEVKGENELIRLLEDYSS